MNNSKKLAIFSQVRYIKFDYNSCMFLPLTYWATLLKRIKETKQVL